MNFLELISEFCGRRALDVPGSIVGSTDQTIIQLKGLANECLTDITNRGASWAKLQKEATFTTIALDDQGPIATVAPYGFKYILPDTLFDRTQGIPLYLPLNGKDWQQAKALPTTGPAYAVRIWKGNIFFNPAPPAGHIIAFEYASDMAILDADGQTWKKRFNKDTDVFQLDEDLLLSGLHWRWRREQGLSYAQEKLDYEALIVQMMGTEPTKGALNLGDGGGDIRPGVLVPVGNWNVS